MATLLAESHSGFIDLKQLSIFPHCWIITKENTIRSATGDAFHPLVLLTLVFVIAGSLVQSLMHIWQHPGMTWKALASLRRASLQLVLFFYSFQQCKQETFLKETNKSSTYVAGTWLLLCSTHNVYLTCWWVNKHPYAIQDPESCAWAF